VFDNDLDSVQQPEGASEGTHYVAPIWWNGSLGSGDIKRLKTMVAKVKAR